MNSFDEQAGREINREPKLKSWKSKLRVNWPLHHTR